MNETREAASPLSERSKDIAAAWGPQDYDDLRAPFSPGAAFPEYPLGAQDEDGSPNEVYRTVRESLRLLGLDAERYGTPEWNPLGHVVARGDTVVLKPNFVRDFRDSSPSDGDCLITHGAVIRAVLDYAYIAAGPRGRVIIADAPQNDADFDAIRRIAGLDEIRALYRARRGFDVAVRDLRPERARKVDGVIIGHVPLAGDPAGYVRVNLEGHSAFAELGARCSQLYGAEYDRAELTRHHHGEVHEYLIAGTILEADCVISVPKLKTHKKTGITVNLKNLVGVNGNKNWLPHHREGTPSQGGDEFAEDGLKHRVEGLFVAEFKRVFPLLGPFKTALAVPLKTLGRWIFGDTNRGAVRSGNWHGNDTVWRMVHDLNRILLYADSNGELHGEPVRRSFCVVDGIVAGEGNGPLDATPKPAGLILAGENALAVDLSCARLMGFDRRRMPMLERALDPHPLPLAAFAFGELRLRSNDPFFAGRLADLEGALLAFEPHFGWKGHIEIAEGAHEASAFA